MRDFDAFSRRFRAKLRRLRIERGLRQEDLERDGLALPTIRRIESGERQPRLDAVFLLAKALGVEPAELLDVADEPPVRDSARRGGARSRGKPAG